MKKISRFAIILICVLTINIISLNWSTNNQTVYATTIANSRYMSLISDRIDLYGGNVMIVEDNGTVTALGYGNDHGELDVNQWKDIVAISTGGNSTVGLKKDGTVVATGDNSEGQCNVSDWTDIVQVQTSYDNTVGLKKDGTVVFAGSNSYGQCNVSDWTDIVQVANAGHYTIGLKRDGTVIGTGKKDLQFGTFSIGNWKNIVQISSDGEYIVGLKENGTVVGTGKNAYSYGQLGIDEWTDIVGIEIGSKRTIGLKKDGTLIATNIQYEEPLDLRQYVNIVAVGPVCSWSYVFAIKSDGTVITNIDDKNIKNGLSGIKINSLNATLLTNDALKNKTLESFNAAYNEIEKLPNETIKEYLLAQLKTTGIVKVTTISLNKTTGSLIVGGTDTLIKSIAPLDATYRDVIWASSDNNIATVDNIGKVTAVSKGSATITVTTVDGRKLAKCNYTVTNFDSTVVIPPVVTKIDLTKVSNGSVMIGDKVFELSYANDPKNNNEITSIIISGGLIYIKDFLGNWIDNITGKIVESSTIKI
ncbi:Ig-like domain-containing protein [Clostridium tagluense]|uniref:BIG2 domain-containing protein n=1 Tax=Clostridium tagluense TaxID=360422 RepID=A0A401UUH8_9CLOT|nr:Ig-like domain-containing protein [Clostridium tagluense]GCD13205.1 hypothetical protein Ctaglu_48280 [Clostridium tagluense]